MIPQSDASGGKGRADEYYYGDGYFQMRLTLPNPKSYVGKRVTVYEEVTEWVQDGGNNISHVSEYWAYGCNTMKTNDTSDNESSPGKGAKPQLKNPKTEIGKHEDTKDELQTLHYPEIHTTLYLNNMKNGQEYDLKQTKLEKGITDISARRHERERQPAVLQQG